MKNQPFILSLFLVLSCQQERKVIEDHVAIKVSQYEYKDTLRALVQPQIRSESELAPFERRFVYLFYNVAEFLQPDLVEVRREIKALYPDTTQIEKLYLEEFKNDKKLIGYFEDFAVAIQSENIKIISYSETELMEVASKFFYFWKVNEDSTLASKVCVGLNGISEANWPKDLTLLEAFCFEAIFYGISDDKDSQIWNVYSDEKTQVSEYHRSKITSLDLYLNNAKLDLFDRMQTSEILKSELLEYYNRNKDNLPFEIKYEED